MRREPSILAEEILFWVCAFFTWKCKLTNVLGNLGGWSSLHVIVQTSQRHEFLKNRYFSESVPCRSVRVITPCFSVVSQSYLRLAVVSQQRCCIAVQNEQYTSDGRMVQQTDLCASIWMQSRQWQTNSMSCKTNKAVPRNSSPCLQGRHCMREQIFPGNCHYDNVWGWKAAQAHPLLVIGGYAGDATFPCTAESRILGD